MRLNVPRPIVCATSSPFFAVGCASAGTCLCMCCRAKEETTTKQTRSSFAAPDVGLKCAALFVHWGSRHKGSRVRGFCDGVCRK